MHHHQLQDSVASPFADPRARASSSFSSSSAANDYLPDYIRGLPQRFQKEDIDYLTVKGALTIPDVPLRNELLRSYVHYVHPYMPILNLDEFLQVIALNDGAHPPLSLLLFQAVMFAGTAFVDLRHLQAAGYPNRKMARKIFFQRTRLLYDFDYEVDRISLVQALLLMTHWYETPDDQKDTWHWMGVSLSLAHTIGLHRDPANSQMDKSRQRLWKRIWWSTYCRDRLIALGMRRPMRVKDDDSDVPMLTLDDYEFKPVSPEVVRLLLGSSDSSGGILSNIDYQKELALMFIEKAKLCLLISRVLSAQYSVLSHKLGGTMETTMMLVPKKSSAEVDEVRRCDAQLENWRANIPSLIQYSPSLPGVTLSEAEEVMHSHRALLQMVYLSTSSALHRPQVLPATPTPSVDGELQEMSRKKVRYAAVEITNVAQDLHSLDLTRYLPTTGVTVILPAVIIHLLDIKASDASVRVTSFERFCHCMRILERLREIYASADFAASFLEAAVRKAGIQIDLSPPSHMEQQQQQQPFSSSSIQPDFASHQHEFDAAMRQVNALTPPPDQKLPEFPPQPLYSSTATVIPQAAPGFFVSTPPQSEGSENGSTNNINPHHHHDTVKDGSFFGGVDEFMDLANEAEVTQNDFDALINFDHEDNNNALAHEKGGYGFSVNLPYSIASDGFGGGGGGGGGGLGDITISSASADFASALVDSAEREAAAADESKLMDLGVGI